MSYTHDDAHSASLNALGKILDDVNAAPDGRAQNTLLLGAIVQALIIIAEGLHEANRIADA